MHHPHFQELEASWRGLHYLVSKTESSVMLRIRLLNVSKKELLKDLERAIEVESSALFKKVYEEEYGTFAGAPYAALIGDYYFSLHPKDLALLKHLANLASFAQAPFIASASPGLFGWDRFTDMTSVRDPSKIFDRTEYLAWRAFRNSENSRYVALTMPRILLRLPYVPRVSTEGEFQFAEKLDADGASHLFGNGAYAFGTCLTNAFAKYQWCADIRGAEGGGVISGLPVWNSVNDQGEPVHKSPVEIAITDHFEKEFSDLGFIPLLHYPGTDYAVIFAASSCNKPAKYDSDVANMNARLAGQLQYVMTTSRFGHYIRCVARDMIGSFIRRGDCERYLNDWISNYVNHTEQVSPTLKAQFPLREARIDVAEVIEKPGHYKAVVFMRPYFQLEELSVSLRFCVDLPAQLHL
jgi:type VI secretion system protein ImpC